MADTVSVTQADRALFFDLFEISERNREKVMRGEEDWRPQMQRIAAFRRASTQPAPAFPREEVAQAARFLLDRLVDHEVRMTSDEDAREWHGHVTPAMARLRALLQGKQP